MFGEFETVIESISFPRAIECLKLSGNQKDKEWRGDCPACKSEHTLVITEGKGYFCQTAKQGGRDVIGLAAHVLGFKKADGKPAMRDAAHYLASFLEEPKEEQQSAQKETQAPVVPQAAQKPRSFDRAKYQASLDRTHELLKDVPEEFRERADLGVSKKGTHPGLINIPLYDKDTGEFLCYAGVPSIRLPKGFQ